MKLTQSKKFNPNYAAKIVKIETFTKHPNPKCERLKCCVVDGYSIAVSIDQQPGLYIYFPVGSKLDNKYLSVNNLFRDKTKNSDKTKGGFFEDNCRIKMIKLQGYPSEGFIMPLSSISIWAGVPIDCKEGTEFDSVNDKVLCEKYVVHRYISNPTSKVTKSAKKYDKVIEEQFRFHYDTILIKKCPNVIQPNDIISITAKVHGTSGISAYVRCKTPKTWSTRIASFICKILPHCYWEDIDYGYLYSSRSVIKNKYYNENVGEGYYGVDIWKYADDVIKPHLLKGMTVYYEIVGYLPSGKAIQSLGGKAFDYGCIPPEREGEYIYGKHFDIQVYRCTYTNPDGRVLEFSAKQVQQWCAKEGLKAVEEYYYGYARDLYPELTSYTDDWGAEFIKRLGSDKNMFMEQLSPTCQNSVPHEGIVIKKENMLSEAFKLKCIRFLEGESKALDKGESDIESES